MPRLFVIFRIIYVTGTLGSHEPLQALTRPFRKALRRDYIANGAPPPEDQNIYTAKRQHRRCSLWVLPSTPSVLSILPPALAHGFSFLRKLRNRFCLHGCVFDSRICHIYPFNILSLTCSVVIDNTSSHLKHEISVEEPSWLCHSGRLTVKGCRSKTPELWLSW